MSDTIARFNARKAARRAVRCRHFTGLQFGIGVTGLGSCAVGIDYRSKRDVSRPGMATWPCTDRDCPTTCDKYAPNTPEEIAADEAETLAAIREVEERGARGECLHCGTPIARRVQVGPCIYAEPCGHRQGQGRLPRGR